MLAEKYGMDRTAPRPQTLTGRYTVTLNCYIAMLSAVLQSVFNSKKMTRMRKAVNWTWFFGWNEIFEGIILEVWKISTRDATATPSFLLGRQTLVSAPAAVRLRVVGLTGQIKSAVKATGWWQFLWVPGQGRSSHDTGPESRLRHGSFLRHKEWHY